MHKKFKIYIGADHRGVAYKANVNAIINSLGYPLTDVGTNDETQSCDYPTIAYKVAKQVVKSKDNRGILVCMSGIGQAIAANKINGAYAALCYNAEAAKLCRQHNNANILVLSSKFTKVNELKKIIKLWLETPFEGGRHQKRLNQIKQIEKGKAV